MLAEAPVPVRWFCSIYWSQGVFLWGLPWFIPIYKQSIAHIFNYPSFPSHILGEHHWGSNIQYHDEDDIFPHSEGRRMSPLMWVGSPVCSKLHWSLVWLPHTLSPIWYGPVVYFLNQAKVHCDSGFNVFWLDVNIEKVKFIWVTENVTGRNNGGSTVPSLYSPHQ